MRGLAVRCRSWILLLPGFVLVSCAQERIPEIDGTPGEFRLADGTAVDLQQATTKDLTAFVGQRVTVKGSLTRIKAGPAVRAGSFAFLVGSEEDWPRQHQWPIIVATGQLKYPAGSGVDFRLVDASWEIVSAEQSADE